MAPQSTKKRMERKRKKKIKSFLRYEDNLGLVNCSIVVGNSDDFQLDFKSHSN